jgi:hypothetical protein
MFGRPDAPTRVGASIETTSGATARPRLKMLRRTRRPRAREGVAGRIAGMSGTEGHATVRGGPALI